jgi:hypothetical protein
MAKGRIEWQFFALVLRERDVTTDRAVGHTADRLSILGDRLLQYNRLRIYDTLFRATYATRTLAVERLAGDMTHRFVGDLGLGGYGDGRCGGDGRQGGGNLRRYVYTRFRDC